MILLADSGSSKTNWHLIAEPGLEQPLTTEGLNPFFETTEDIEETIRAYFGDSILLNVKQIYFYGAGCIKDQTTPIVEKALRAAFPHANILVNDDMLGAARATLGHQSGIACILGTGANSCLYNGQDIIDKVPTLGYILGDEASGSYLGKQFLNDYFKRAIPNNLTTIIQTEFKLQWPDVLKAVYKQPNPNRYLAQFAPFLKQHEKHPYVAQLLSTSIQAFFEKNVMRYDNYRSYPISFVGSIAHNFAEQIREQALKNQLTIGSITQHPIDGLRQYHVEE